MVGSQTRFIDDVRCRHTCLLIYLVYVELVLLHTICAWCTGLHVVILIMFLTTLVLVQRSEDEPEASSDEPAPDRVGTHR